MTPVLHTDGLTVGDHLRLGARLNRSWDATIAHQRIERVGLDPAQKAGRLSGSQRAQLALTLAAAKRPQLMIWGAPLVAREVETGTHRLVWNQSVTPPAGSRSSS